MLQVLDMVILVIMMTKDFHLHQQIYQIGILLLHQVVLVVQDMTLVGILGYGMVVLG